MADAPPPKKYTKINGIVKLNPEYSKWVAERNARQESSMEFAAAIADNSTTAVTPTTLLHASQALPVISSYEDHKKYKESVDDDAKLSEAALATATILQEPEMHVQVDPADDNENAIDQLGDLMEKYEIPIGLSNKFVILSEYQSLEFIIDDSGSMRKNSDVIDKRTRRPITRWQEAHQRLKEMIEIVAYVPFNQIGIEFLNRKTRITLGKNGGTPKEFLKYAYEAIDKAFEKLPEGSTPALKKLHQSFLRGQGYRIARYFFGDGKPDGGQESIDRIVDMVRNRVDPEENPVTFLSCTNDDAAVEWMKDCEEVAPYCSESDDFNDEAREVYRDQGAAMPYTKGFHLICQLVAAMNPDDLDAMDESVPFTKNTLDNLLGVVSNEETYKHYFDCFVRAQQARKLEIDPMTGMPKRIETLRKKERWEYGPFRNTKGPANRIPQVQQFKKALQVAAAEDDRDFRYSGLAASNYA